jgi:hypothetical protein
MARQLAGGKMALVQSIPKQALKNRVKPNVVVMPQWISAGWGGVIAVVESFPNAELIIQNQSGMFRWHFCSF